MARNLPPLNALKAFEAAGRHLSFTKAADELHVTPAAISHQVKALEDLLGVPLFRRLARRLLLTDAGQRLLPGIGSGFDRLAGAVDDLRGLEENGVLTVSVMHSLAARWLVPRLDRFNRIHPEINLLVSSTVRLVDFARDNIDVAIRYGLGTWPGLRADLLHAEELFPVCSPALVDGSHPLRTADDLRHFTLLHDQFWSTISFDDYPDWSAWLTAAGVRDIDVGRGLNLTPSELVIQAAIEGQGVALGRSFLVESAHADGRLVRPFELSIPVDYAYYVVCPEAAADRPKVAAFREWAIAEAAEQERPMPATSPDRDSDLPMPLRSRRKWRDRARSR